MPLSDNLTPQTVHDLEIARQQYQYNYTYIPPVALVDRLPSQENSSKEWYRLLTKQLRILLESILVTSQSGHDSVVIHDDVKQSILSSPNPKAIPSYRTHLRSFTMVNNPPTAL